jgi:hypothetical protein
MSLTITDTEIRSDLTESAYAVRVEAGWQVTGFPGRKFDRNQAITAMTIAEERSRPDPDEVLIASLEGELT